MTTTSCIYSRDGSKYITGPNVDGGDWCAIFGAKPNNDKEPSKIHTYAERRPILFSRFIFLAKDSAKISMPEHGRITSRVLRHRHWEMRSQHDESQRMKNQRGGPA